ncbi:MBOAT family O-acyltransferase [Bradyrhizobium canariense]|uniref:Probable alginate O-acetylase AlgI n=1 Tax=Bradyrhizobium canariense TaxID=255045 RepID=A0A1H1N2S8_9BRAD|nr:MBOAT family protein [Bradyrhizobium canariense]SDR93217.1 D-alanyl-lipoteichoic acid acyltransferase DltB, MBOAT superfamily [Bradyrhizobium canariense]
MLFNSVSFIFVFLPATLLIFFLFGTVSRTLALFFLAVASLVFYAQTNSHYLLILVPSIIVNYLIGSALSRAWIGDRRRFAVVTFGIAANLACLFIFKYLDLFIYTIDSLHVVNIDPLKIELPLGISFFTFTQVAFLVDAYQRKVSETRFLNYALFVSYFPHLVAGPILHHAEMMPQFSAQSTFRPRIENFAIGLSVFFIGLFKKVMIADSLAPHVHRIFDASGQGASFSTLEAWSGALFYALQIYFDFSGYSDMAIGLSLLFGVRLPLNFNSPYKAVNITDFWRRWHMTLSRFLRDYLYIPLGGNRVGETRRLANVMIVMLLGGLWHGASWTFMVWGGLHGIYLMANRAWHLLIGENPTKSRLSILTGRLTTFLLVTVAWVFFRSPTFGTALSIAQSMLGLNTTFSPADPVGSYLPSGDVTAIAAAALAIAWFLPNTQEIMSLYKPALGTPSAICAAPWAVLWRPTVASAIVVGTMAVASLATIIFEKRVGDFIYFQF